MLAKLILEKKSMENNTDYYKSKLKNIMKSLNLILKNFKNEDDISDKIQRLTNGLDEIISTQIRHNNTVFNLPPSNIDEINTEIIRKLTSNINSIELIITMLCMKNEMIKRKKLEKKQIKKIWRYSDVIIKCVEYKSKEKKIHIDKTYENFLDEYVWPI